MFKKKKKLFGNNIRPACTYCEYGNLSADKTMILCEKKGVVSPYYSCNKFSYLPTKRKPRRPPPLPSFKNSDFDI